ncbi:MAG: ribonucleoside-diphosphate reductase subunit alpha [Oscillospiraceae bacterium]
MNIIKRSGNKENFNIQKIEKVIQAAFKSVNNTISKDELEIVKSIIVNELQEMEKNNLSIKVEDIQDNVEKALMEKNYYNEVKSFILYRNERSKRRIIKDQILEHFSSITELSDILSKIQVDFSEDEYILSQLYSKFVSFLTNDISEKDKLSMLTKAAVELTTQEAPKWEYIASRLLMLKFKLNLNTDLKNYNINTFYDKILYLSENGLYGDYILKNYDKSEIDELSKHIDNNRDNLLTYSSLDMLLKRYVVRSLSNHPLETPQEMFMGISMHIAMQEKKENRLNWALKFYDMLSNLRVTMATPTLSNARKPFNQLSSCFIDTVPDDLTGIYRSVANFAQVSKYGGGMGMYLGKIRASGSPIRGFKGASGGVIRWIKMINDTAVAVDQLGVRQGAVAVYLDVWHKDLPEFLQLKTNNGDDRMKAHDVFPAICYPDLFWKMAKEDINSKWNLMCPHDVKTIKGYCLEDFYGKEWEEKYRDCIHDSRISKRVFPIKDIIRLIIKSSVETGTPFTFNRDHVNNLNPNSKHGIIYCSNLCTEIAQNMSEIESVNTTINDENGDTIVVTKTKPGDFVVCNLSSLSLGNIDVTNEKELKEIVTNVIRALDNVIDLNFYPLPYAEVTNKKYRPIGLGISGYHHMLANNNIKWESDEHIKFVDNIFEKINYYAITASCENALEKGSYKMFNDSDWQTGEYFEKRSYSDEKWLDLKNKVEKDGMRNGYLIAIAPTSSTSIIAGTTAGVDPILSRFFLEEKKNGLIPRVAPNLSSENFWLYKNAHLIDQNWIIKAGGVRQKHIDQAQSLNLYITNDFTFKQILELYISAWEQGIKTIYYVRSKSLEVEECDVCSS